MLSPKASRLVTQEERKFWFRAGDRERLTCLLRGLGTQAEISLLFLTFRVCCLVLVKPSMDWLELPTLVREDNLLWSFCVAKGLSHLETVSQTSRNDV